MKEVGVIMGTKIYACNTRKKYYMIFQGIEVEVKPLNDNPRFPPLKGKSND